MTERLDPRLKVLAQRGWLSLTDARFRNAVLAKLTIRSFGAGEAVTRIEDPRGGMWALLDGAVEVEIPGPEVPPHLGHFGIPGFWFGEGVLIYPSARRAGVSTVCPSSLAFLPLTACHAILEADPPSWRWIALLATINTDLAIRLAADTLIRHPEKRTAAMLLRLAGLRGGMFLSPGRVPIDLSQEKLGRLVNLSRNAVAQILTRFVDRGLIRASYRTLEVIDEQGLVDLLTREPAV